MTYSEILRISFRHCKHSVIVKLYSQMGGGQPRGLPKIRSIDDVYKIGVIC
jgi:hypothetical protein